MLIRLSAEQGQIVQEVNNLVVQLTQADDNKQRQKIRSAIIRDLTRFEDTHISLRQGDRFVMEGVRPVHVPGTLSADLQRIYFDVPADLDRHATSFMKATKAMLSVPGGELTADHSTLEKLSPERMEPLISGLSAAVTLYQHESEKMLRETVNLQNFMFIISLTTLALVGTALLRPLVTRLKENALKMQEEESLYR